MNLQSRRTSNTLRTFQIFFYAAFVFLWFKDNFLLFQKIPLSSSLPLVPLVLITAFRAFLKFKSPPPKPRLRFNKDMAAVGLILLLCTAIHIPYLLNHDGLMDSDEAIPSLQGKHIAEGKLPTIYYYSARFQGSLPQHYYALLFKVFGYSIFLVKLAAYLAFAAFLILQYRLLKNVFSREFAAAVGLFYCLPFKHLVLSSFDVGSGFPVVFLLGLLIFTLTWEICERGKDRLLGPLGFVMGLAFWTHQITIVFILTSALFLVLRYRFRIAKYWTLAWSLTLGLLPVLIGEIYWNFPLVRLLSGGESAGRLAWDKILRLKRLLLELISSGPAGANVIYLGLLGLGMVVLAAPSIKKKRLQFSSVSVIYVLAFAAVYLLSASSAEEIIRYLYILYLALPVLLTAVFLWIKPKALGYALTGLLFGFVFLGSSARTSLAHYREIRSLHADLGNVVAAMSATGETYWEGDYWVAFLLDAVSKERLIVASTTVDRYPYYRLVRDSDGARTNRVFFTKDPQEKAKAAELAGLLDRLGKRYETKTIGDWRLVSGIQGYVYPKNLLYPPDVVPDVALAGIEATDAGLSIRFKARDPLPAGGFRIHVEIPGFCAVFSPVGPGDAFSVQVPYPPEPRTRLQYHLDFQGLYLDSTLREKDAVLPAPPRTFRRNDVEFLSGFGPHESDTGKNWQALDKDVRFQINRPLGRSSKISLTLFAPFNIADIIYWSGDFSQVVEVFVNDRFVLRKTLADGSHVLDIDGRDVPFERGPNIITLRFKYALVISITNHWRTAAYLEDIRIEEIR